MTCLLADSYEYSYFSDEAERTRYRTGVRTDLRCARNLAATTTPAPLPNGAVHEVYFERMIDNSARVAAAVTAGAPAVNLRTHAEEGVFVVLNVLYKLICEHEDLRTYINTHPTTVADAIGGTPGIATPIPKPQAAAHAHKHAGARPLP